VTRALPRCAVPGLSIVALALVLVARAPAGHAAPAGGTLESARALAGRLRASGRAEAQVERRALDAFTGKWRSSQGRVALEPPDRALLEFPATGERVALRGDGGEWLQPALGQMLRLGPANAAAARRWWELLLPGAGVRFAERKVGPGRFAVTREGARDPDTAEVALDAQGLPARLEYRIPGADRVEYRLRSWRFPRARGRDAFVLHAPDSLQVVDLP
jgi:hypothetical protein